MEERISLITLGVEDLNTMRLFYENIFEWKATDNSNENIVFFHLNGFLLSLYDREDLAKDAKVRARGEGFKSFTLAYNLKSKEEVDRLFDKLEAKGVDIAKDPEETDWGAIVDTYLILKIICGKLHITLL